MKRGHDDITPGSAADGTGGSSSSSSSGYVGYSESEPPFKRAHHHDDEGRKVDAHYSGRQRNLQERVESPIFHLRNLNNWIKSVVFGVHLKEGDWVLDLAGGKGGDMTKFGVANAGHVELIDIAEGSVRDALERYNQSGSRAQPWSFSASFVVADLRRVRLIERLPAAMAASSFSLTSCQFAAHYFFGCREHALQLLINATDRLKPHGYFVLTVPDSRLVIQKLQQGGGTFGNEIYRLTADPAECMRWRDDDAALFGARYTYWLCDAVDNIPEYVVTEPTLRALGREVGLSLCMAKNFHEMFHEFQRDERFASLLHRMKVLRRDGRIDERDWEAAGVYRVFVFRKKPSSRYHPVDPASILVIDAGGVQEARGVPE